MQQPGVKVSVIISVYNKIDFLRLVLAGFRRQSFGGYEIILADDGSGQSFVDEAEMLAVKMSVPVKHLWQDDKGFRKNRILNKAVTAAEGDLIIFIDGDCIPHREFVKEHFEAGRAGVCSTGRRVNLSQKISSRLNEEIVEKGYLENSFIKMAWDGITGESTDVEKGLYFRNGLLRRYFNRKKRGIVGCNFSLYKKDLLAVNGFDERYEAPSIGEDSDLQYRLELNGIQIKPLNHMAVQYHLYHKLQPRPQENLNLFESVKKEGKAFTDYGIIKESGTKKK